MHATRFSRALALLLAAATSVAQVPKRPESSRKSSTEQSLRLVEVHRDASFVLKGKESPARRCWLQGLDVEGQAAARVVAKRIEGYGKGADTLRVRVDGKDRTGRTYVVLRRKGDGKSLNERLLEEGLAFFRTNTKTVAIQKRLLAASQLARRSKLGVWKGLLHREGPPPRQAGAVLGLYYKEEKYHYHKQLEQIQASGASWVTLLLTVFVDKVDSNVIERYSARTVTDKRFLETMRYARGLGLRVGVQPIVLIRNAGEDDWRGTLRPSDPGRFWIHYDRMICHYLDLARRGKAELFSVGSELCSLEREEEAWRRIIANARGRFPAWLSYSVNWDHYDVPRFWDALDQVGMTAYFELTKEKDASYSVLRDAWRSLRKDLKRMSTRLGRPIVLTELGYTSQDGTATAPWNYYVAPKKPDFREQRDCFRAFEEAMRGAGFLRGVYIFDWFEKGGMEDTTYSVWEKPAYPVVKRILKSFREKDPD